MMEPEPSKRPEDDNTRPIWRPFQKIKKILQRRNARSRSNSPTNYNLCLFTAGQIVHAHTTAPVSESPSKYLLVAISPRGSILPFETDTKYPCVGFLVCECEPEHQFTSHPKQISFISEAHPLPSGHYIDSPFVFPELSPAQTITSKSYPLFYKLPSAYQEITSLEGVDTEKLISEILVELTNLSDPVIKDDIEHVYQQLFNTAYHRAALSSSSSSSPSIVDEASGWDAYFDGRSESPSEPPPNIPNTTKCTNAKDTLGIFVYKNQKTDDHGKWSSFTPKEIDSVMNHLEPTGAPQLGRIWGQLHLSLNLKLKGQKGFSGIFFEKRDSTIQCYRVIPKNMPRIYNDLIYVATKDHYKTYTLAQPEEIVPKARLVTVMDAPEILMWFDNMKKRLMNQELFFHVCGICGQTFDKQKRLTHHLTTHHAKSKMGHRSKKKGSSTDSDDSQVEQYSMRSGEQHNTIQPARQLKHRYLENDQNLQEGILQKQIYEPPILDQLDCPRLYITFWGLRALTLRETANNKRMSRFVAPKFPINMLELEKQVNYQGMLSDEFISYAKAYENLASQKDYASVDQYSQFQVGVKNSAHDLANYGRGSVLEVLRRQAPVLEEKRLSALTESALQSFFFQARCYMLSSSIPWDSFPEFFLTSAALGPDILTRVNNALLGYPTHRKVLRTFSTFIERIIRILLPAEESYNDAESRIIEEHKANLLGPVPNIDHTRTMLQADSRDLVTKSPYFKQVQNTISDESKRLMIEAEKTNLLHKIISNTTYEAKLYKLLIASDSYKTINTVPYPVLLDHLQNLIIAEKKSEVALVNANRLAHKSRDTQKSILKSPPLRSSPPTRRTPTKGRSPNRQQRDRTQSPRNESRRPSSRSPKARDSRQSSPFQLQQKCDLCLKMSYPTEFCLRNKHCRRGGHQPTFRDSKTFQQRVDRNEKNLFVTHDECTKCDPFKNRPAQWLHGNTSSQVMIPSNYFQQMPPIPPQYIDRDQAQFGHNWPHQYQYPPPIPPNRGRQSPGNVPNRPNEDRRNRSPFNQGKQSAYDMRSKSPR